MKDFYNLLTEYKNNQKSVDRRNINIVFKDRKNPRSVDQNIM